jgi:hypothetical protein
VKSCEFLTLNAYWMQQRCRGIRRERDSPEAIALQGVVPRRFWMIQNHLLTKTDTLTLPFAGRQAESPGHVVLAHVSSNAAADGPICEPPPFACRETVTPSTQPSGLDSG